jgi:alkanesulfonate monooxygenase SsuD/methylene tetrahydromethanopterin reductase-like flavin-dependent oxidoreductase (luciferase family)
MPYFRIVYVAEDEKRAITDPQEGVTWISDLTKLRHTLTKGSEINIDLNLWRHTRTEELDKEESLLSSNVYFGTPEQCVQRIRRLQKEHNIQYFGANMGFGGLAHAKEMRSMELFAKEVMPHFR